LARTTEMREQPARPALSTILSSSNVVPQTKRESGVQTVNELSTNSASNSRAPSPSQRLSPNANAMPATIPSVESKFPGASTFQFPRPATEENTGPGNLSA
jgi:hypothetical protein